MNHPFLFEFLTFAFVISVVEVVERKWGAYEIQRSWQWRLNLVALCVVIIGSKISTGTWNWVSSHLLFDEYFHSEYLRKLSSFPKILIAIFSVDFCLFLIHWLMHNSKILWIVHKFHHTPKIMFWLSGSRTSFFHLFVFALPQVVIPFYFLKIDALEASVLLSFSLIINIWVHMNYKANIGFLSWFFITPQYHRIHHANSYLSGMNLGFVHTVWDRLFGTYVDPNKVQNFDLGLVRDEEISWKSLLGI
ncbi:MAG: sterol desaturase family protein [Deltaproteobacteria bacterium]|nr:sterol desaturase family protein [Deltaproteobacteria bacterium]